MSELQCSNPDCDWTGNCSDLECGRIMAELQCSNCDWTGDYDSLGYDNYCECCPKCGSFDITEAE